MTKRQAETVSGSSGLGVQGLGISRVRVYEFRVYGAGLRVWIEVSGLRVTCKHWVWGPAECLAVGHTSSSNRNTVTDRSNDVTSIKTPSFY